MAKKAKKKFTFRFVVSHTYDVTLDEDSIYPDLPWHLTSEHSRVKKDAKLTAARVEKTVHANGGPAAIWSDWAMDMGADLIRERIQLRVRPARKTRRVKP